MLSLGSGLSGVLRGPSWPELQFGTRAAGVNVPMVCVAEVLSLVSGWRPPVCARQVLAEKWKPSLAEVLSLGLGLSGVFGGPELAETPAQHLCGTKLDCSCSSKLRNPPGACLGALRFGGSGA